MAVYQYVIQLIPRTAVAKKYGEIPDLLVVAELTEYEGNNELDTEIGDAWMFDWWKNENIQMSVAEDFFGTFLNEVEWSKHHQGIKSYGNDDSNDISIEFSNDKIIEGIYCRIDLREIDEPFIKNILKLANQLDCLILDINGRLYEPSPQPLFENIEKSNSFKFVSNPDEFLRKLATAEILPK